MITSKLIRVSEETKNQLDKIKEHHRETYDDLIIRLIKEMKKIKID